MEHHALTRPNHYQISLINISICTKFIWVSSFFFSKKNQTISKPLKNRQLYSLKDLVSNMQSDAKRLKTQLWYAISGTSCLSVNVLKIIVTLRK